MPEPTLGSYDLSVIKIALEDLVENAEASPDPILRRADLAGVIARLEYSYRYAKWPPRPTLPDPSEGLRTGRQRAQDSVELQAQMDAQRAYYAVELRRIARKEAKRYAVRDEALALGFSYTEASNLQLAENDRRTRRWLVGWVLFWLGALAAWVEFLLWWVPPHAH